MGPMQIFSLVLCDLHHRPLHFTILLLFFTIFCPLHPSVIPVKNNKSMSTAAATTTTATRFTTDPPEQPRAQPAALSRYESQKRRDWNTFCQYLRNMRPPVPITQCTCHHVLEFLRYLDQFGKTKVHVRGCVFFGQPDPPAPCACPLRQAWGSLDALIGRLRAAYEENGGSPETNPFGNGAIRIFLREVKESQAKARGIPYKKRKKKKINNNNNNTNLGVVIKSDASSSSHP